MSPWLTTTMVKLIRKKHRLFKQFKAGKITYRQFNTYCKVLKELAESSYHRHRFNDSKHDSKRKWKHLNGLMGRDSRETVSSLNINDTIVNSPSDVATHGNNYYRNIAGKMQSKMRRADVDFGLMIEENPVHLECFQPITENEIIITLNELKNNSVLSDIPTKFLKLCHIELSKILCPLYNRCLSEAHYPSILKRAIVTPILKSGDKTKIENYRPISVLPVLNKIFEKLIHNRIYNFFCENNLISDNQYGFMKHRSTSQAIVHVLNKLLPAIRDQNFSILLLIDLSKAFDSVSHNLLLAELHRYGVRDNALCLLRSYLSNREQCVKVLNFDSEFCYSEYGSVSVGVPQGSVLGPLLYIIFANDLNNLISKVDTVTYADDIALCINGDSPSSLATIMNSELQLISNWSRFNRLPINYGKCHAVVISNRALPSSLSIVLDSINIPIVTSTNYLGVIIDSKLNFSNHLEHINSKLAQFSGIAWKISFKLNINAAKIFYFSFIFSLLSYGIVAWGGVLMTYKCPRLHGLFKRATCNLFAWHFPGESFQSICFKLGLLIPVDIYKFNIMTMYVKMRQGHYLPPLKFEPKVTYYSDRRHSELRVPFPRTNAMKISYEYRIPMIWNSLPTNIKDEPRVNKFRAEYKKHLLRNEA